MQKTIKKIILVALALALISLPLNAFAKDVAMTEREDSAENSMETALIAAKDLIDIDDDLYTEFNYSSGYSNYETREGLIWYFSWWDAKNSYIRATVAADGTLLAFYKSSYDARGFGFAEISKEEAVAKADNFIIKANPGAFSYYKSPMEVSTSLYNGDYNLVYYSEVNGYSFEAATITVSVDKRTGEVTGYYTRNIDPGRYRFEAAQNLIGESAAISAYAQQIGLGLEYMSYFDYEKSEFTVFPAYLWGSYGDRFISALTGDVVTYVYDRGASDRDGASDASEAPMAEDGASGGGSGSKNLTPAEKAAIEQVAGFITSGQALQKLLEAAELTDLDPDTFNEQYIGLNRDYMFKDRYFYDISMYKYWDYSPENYEISGLYGRVDALTGRVLSFNFYFNNTPYPGEASVWTEEKVGALVGEFLQKQAPGELAASKLENTYAPRMEPYGYSYGNYYFSYTRYANDVPFRDNGISVTFNQNVGKITGYSINWYNDISFPDIGAILSPQQSLEAYVGQQGSKLRYITTGDANASLVYDFGSRYMIDPFTGKAVEYTGQLLTDGGLAPDYTDAAGHWAQVYVDKLLENGIYLWGGPFEPEKVMTELEFLQYIMLVEPPYIAFSDALAFFATRGMEVGASPDKNLTKQEAARIIAEYLGYGKLAEQAEWFVYPFADDVDPAYKGYITVCYMLGIVGGSNGSFDATMNVTRAHAAGLLHNLILARSE